MARFLSVGAVESAKPNPKKRIEIADGAVSGLYLVVQPSGSRSWAVRYRHHGRPAKLTLGPYPRMGLSDARDGAKEALRLVSEGKSPTADRVTLAQTGHAVMPPMISATSNVAIPDAITGSFSAISTTSA